MSPRSATTTVLTLVLGGSALVTAMSGEDNARPPVGARTAFELISTKSGRNLTKQREVQQRSAKKQFALKSSASPSRGAASVDMARGTASDARVQTA